MTEERILQLAYIGALKNYCFYEKAYRDNPCNAIYKQFLLAIAEFDKIEETIKQKGYHFQTVNPAEN